MDDGVDGISICIIITVFTDGMFKRGSCVIECATCIMPYFDSGQISIIRTTREGNNICYVSRRPFTFNIDLRF